MENSESQTNHLKTHSEKVQVLHSECVCLHEDICALLQNVQSYISNRTKHSLSESENYEYLNDHNTDEKEDGSNEKDLGVVVANDDTTVEPCNTDAELEIADVDWSVAGPAVKKHVADLVKIHTLNAEATALIRRLKALAPTKSINDSSDNKEETGATLNSDSNP